MSNPIVVITAPCHPWLIQQLGNRFTVRYEPAITYEALMATIGPVTGLIVSTRLSIDEALLQQAPQLAWIGRLGSGLELIDQAAAQKRNIRLVSSPEGNRNAVAEHALGLLLMLLNKLHSSFDEVKQGQWIRDANRGDELTGKTVGLIGFGNTGGRFAQLLAPFDVRILACDPYKTIVQTPQLQQVSLTQLQAEAQVVSFHVPLTPETRHLANAHFFEGLQRQPLLLNTSRGKVVDTAALIAALQNKQVSGTALDVLENENLAGYSLAEEAQLQWLCAQPNVIITPHIAGYSHQAFLKMAQVVYQKLTPHF